MDGEGVPGEAKRVSSRPNKGVPPLRYRSSVAGSTRKGSKSSVISKTSSTGQRKELEAKRDEEIVQLQQEYSSRLKSKKILKVKIKQVTRCRDEFQSALSRTSDDTSAAKVKEFDNKLLTLEEELEILNAELESIEATFTAKMKAIKSRCDADLEKIDIEEDEALSSTDEEVDENQQHRTKEWTSSQVIAGEKSEDEEERPDEVGNITFGGQRLHSFSPFAQPFTFDDLGSPRTRPYHYFSQRDDVDTETGFPEKIKGSKENQRQNFEARQNDSIVNQLVEALSKTFGSNQSQVLVKNSIDRNLPKFDGNPADWENYRSEYQRTTIKYKYEDSENLTRLRATLTGDALQAVKHLLSNDKNLIKIWDTLEKRFGRPEFVLDYLVEKAKSTKTPDVGKPESMIEFGTAIDALVTNICSYNQMDYMNNKQLVTEFVNKLPIGLRTQWHEWLLDHPRRKNTLEYFSRWLSRKVDAAILALKPKLTKDSKDEEFKRGRGRGMGAVNTTSVEKDENSNCACCDKKNHSIDKCWKFTKASNKERWSIVKEKNLCLSCLKVGHRSFKCQEAVKCPKEGCGRWHHLLLHLEDKKNIKSEKKHEEKETPLSSQHVSEKKEDIGQINVAVIKGCDGPLQVVPVKIKNSEGNKTVNCYALLDGGASRSLMTKDLASQLDLTGSKTCYRYSGIAGEQVKVKNAMTLDCQVSGVFSGARFDTASNCVTVDEIRMTPYSFNLSEAKRRFPHLKKVKGEDLIDVVPSFIIGNNNPDLIVPNRIARGRKGEPVGLRTKLGWTVSGNFDVVPGHGSISATTCGEEATDDYLHDLIKSFFTVENFGVRPTSKKGDNLEEKRAWEILENTTKKIPGGWETGLLWREDGVQMPDGEEDALRRLYYTERKMRDPVFRGKYTEKIAEYLEKGYLKKLTDEEARIRPPHTRYIPHFGQINPNKPDKFRFIMDAKAICGGTSLNDKLLKGPDLIRPLTSVLMNFRRHAIALTGDIADMFHRVQVRKEDRCSQRILWRDGDENKPADHYEMQVLIFGATSSPSSAIYTKNRNAYDFKESLPEAAEVIQTDFYVDDCLTGGDSAEEVIKLRRDISKISDVGGFRLCKFMSNSPDVLASIPEDLKANGVKGLEEKEEMPAERVLGLWWNPNEDAFTFKVNLHKVKQRVLAGAIPTKREISGLVMSLYDPLGFINHYKIKGLMILQEVWRCGVGWDDEIPHNINENWQRWLHMLSGITEVKVPRCYSPLLLDAKDVQLHIFQDASEESYSCVCYLRINVAGQTTVAFVCSKVKVAPLKKLTIPRLELQAAVLGSRMANTICQELRINITSRWFWSDSKTVLSWIRATGVRYKEFVANRIGEIQEFTNASEWHWVPTKLNIADQATRFESKISFSATSDWYMGPEFLWQDQEHFPTEETSNTFISTTLVSEDAGNTEMSTPIGTQARISIVPNPSRFSSYYRLLRATAAVIRCCKFWLQKVRKHETHYPFGPGKMSLVNTEDLGVAENLVLRFVQEEEYEGEIRALKSGNNIPTTSKIWRLNPILDRKGLLRIDGRVGAADVSYSAKFPVILPPRHHISNLIVDREHEACAHQGKETVLSNIRQRFWIPEGRRAVQRCLERCGYCKLKRSKPISPRMGNLPHFRLAFNHRAFHHTGLDFFGPIVVTVGRRHEKRWGALFCCLSSRAVHLEVCHGLSTDEVMMALSRFMDTRGRPATIVSDNGTNFVGAAKELKESLRCVNFMKIASFGKFQATKWIFNPPAAPHMGGSWERLVQTVKKCLYTVLRERFPRDTTLLTTIKAVENIVNSRPLTYASTDPTDPEAITPNHILRSTSDVGPSIATSSESSGLREQWKRTQAFADQFWTLWRNHYLPKLLRRDKWNQFSQPLGIGDLVFLINDSQPRNCWTRGYISAVFPGADGQVRVVEVTAKDPETNKTTVYKRPTVKVCPLGLRMEIKDSTGT